MEGELTLTHNKLKTSEKTLHAQNYEHKDLLKQADYFKRLQTKEKEINQRIMHNVKRLTLKLRKAQLIIFEMENNKDKNEFTYSSKDFEIDETYDFDTDIDEKTQLMLVTELRDRVEKYIEQAIETHYGGAKGN